MYNVPRVSVVRYHWQVAFSQEQVSDANVNNVVLVLTFFIFVFIDMINLLLREKHFQRVLFLHFHLISIKFKCDGSWKY